MTTQVEQLGSTSEQALEQAKPPIRTFPLANKKQSQYLHAVQHLATELSADLKTEKQERLKRHATIRQLEDKLTRLRRQGNEPSSSSLPVPSKVDLWCSTKLQDKRAVEDAQILKLIPKFSVLGASSTLEPRFKQLEEEIIQERDCREEIMSTF